MEVHYRWHPLYGRRVRLRDIEQRNAGRVAHVEVNPDVVMVVAAWMLDAAACAGMTAGEPRVNVAALCDLHQILRERTPGHLLDSSHPVQEKPRKHSAQDSSKPSAVVTASAASDENDVRGSRTASSHVDAARKRTDTSRQSVVTGGKRRRQGGGR